MHLPTKCAPTPLVQGAYLSGRLLYRGEEEGGGGSRGDLILSRDAKEGDEVHYGGF